MTPSSTLTNDDQLPSTDSAALARLQRFGGEKLLGEMISLFLGAAPERIAAARKAVEESDPRNAEMALHSLKSSSAQLGAMRMQRLCERGELIARDGSVATIDRLVEDLEEEFVIVQRWLERARNPENA